MSTDEYVPSDEDVRESYVTGQIRDGYGADWDDLEPGAVMDFDAWLAAHDARVRRDAAREALDGYAAAEEASFLDLHVKGAVMSAAACQHARFAATEYRDAHYPEETPHD